jgi:hypothetical protein
LHLHKQLLLLLWRSWHHLRRFDDALDEILGLRAKGLEVALCFLWVTETVKTTGWLILLKKKAKKTVTDWLNSNFHNIISKSGLRYTQTAFNLDL